MLKSWIVVRRKTVEFFYLNTQKLASTFWQSLCLIWPTNQHSDWLSNNNLPSALTTLQSNFLNEQKEHNFSSGCRICCWRSSLSWGEERVTHLPHNIFLLANYTADDGGGGGGDGQEDIKQQRQKQRQKVDGCDGNCGDFCEVPLRWLADRLFSFAAAAAARAKEKNEVKWLN